MQDNPTPSPAPDFPIVGIGASAGGLEAVKTFFEALPADLGMAYVVITHTNAGHESLLAELLAKYTAMPVIAVTEAVSPLPDHIYVALPGYGLVLGEKGLEPSANAEAGDMHTPIDRFFKTLAETRQELAVGLIFSGALSDGSQGLRTIKQHGGLVLVQEPATAGFNGMPRSAIDSGLVDLVLPVAKMPAALMDYRRYLVASHAGNDAEEAGGNSEKKALHKVLAVLKTQTGYDFYHYKKNTLQRRIQRRMSLCRIDGYDNYAERLRREPGEAANLLKDLLIGVTGFFREPEVWEELKSEILPHILMYKAYTENHEPLRAWVVGCASGEEAYTLGMLLSDACRTAEYPGDFQIFATDIDTAALDTARRGVYPASVVRDIPPDYLTRFFEQDGERWQIKKEVRDRIIFALQNVISDPPYSNLDLISCRNLLIYLEPSVQRKILELFHFTLVRNGYLLLGSAETADSGSRFYSVSKRSKLFQISGARQIPKLPFFTSTPGRQVMDSATRQTEATGDGSAPMATTKKLQAVEKAILKRLAPACVVVNRELEILNLYGAINAYLDLPQGELGKKLDLFLGTGLRLAIHNALHAALRNRSSVEEGFAKLTRNGKIDKIHFKVDVLKDTPLLEDLYLITLQQVAQAPEIPVDTGGDADEESLQLAQLEEELSETRHELQTTIEQLEASNEELKAANEEMVSMNEELQSTNEELESSKEELQSLNEELTTVNAELQEKVKQEEGLNNDLINFLNSTEIATMFLDSELCIRRFTPATKNLFNVIPSDVGRPVSDLAQRFNDPDLQEDAAKVMKQLIPLNREVKTDDGRWFSRNILPFRTLDNKIEGVIINFTEVTALVQSQTELRHAKDQAEAANRAKSAFLANMSHELRTPLNVIMGYTQILEQKRRGLPEEAVKEIGIIYQSGQHLLTLVNDVLDLARIEAGRLELNPEPFHPAELLEDLSGMFTIRAASKGLAFNYQSDNNLPAIVRGDPKRLRQVLINLLANAVKYTKQGSVSLRAAYANGGLNLEVEDTGNGIPAAYLDKIFQPFYQVETPGGYQDGVGLGLAITRTFTDLMDGTIQVDSTPEQGTVFRLRLPLPVEKSAHSPRVEVAVGTRCTGYRRLAGEGPFRVLVTDDMADSRLMLAIFLENLGFEVIQAVDGSECLYRLQRQVPDLLLLDLAMPSPDGLEVVETLRRQPACAKLPVIAVTALAFENNRKQALAAGCTDFIAKPLNFSRLLEQIGKYLPLAWEYFPAESEQTDSVADIAAALKTRLSADETNRLLKAVKMGDVSRISQFVAHLETRNCCPEAAEALKRFADKFQMKKLRALVEQLEM